MQSVLEQRFPHIVARLTEVWLDGRQAREYLDALLFKESARAERQGFTNDLWLELIFLNDLLRIEYPPQTSPHAIDIWAEAADVPSATS
jgi:hypothetical protein